MGFLAGFVQQLLPRRALEGASVPIPRAELPKPTSCAGSSLGAIFVIAATGNKVMSREDLSCWALVAIRFRLDKINRSGG